MERPQLDYDVLLAQTEVKLDLPSLQAALAKHPGRYAQWAWLEAEARHRTRELDASMLELERQVKETEAELFIQYKDELTPREGRGPTVEAIKAAVQADPKRAALEQRRAALQAKIDAATFQAEQLKVGRETMRDQKEILMEIARNIRQQMECESPGFVSGVRGDVARARAKDQAALLRRRTRPAR